MAFKMTSHMDWIATQPKGAQQWLSALALVVPLLDRIPNVRFFAVDAAGFYVGVNQAFLQHHDIASLSAIIGKKLDDIALPGYAPAYQAQDRTVLIDGQTVNRQLQLHLDASRHSSWCLALKSAIYAQNGERIGMMASFTDLSSFTKSDPLFARIAPVYAHIRKNCQRTIPISEMTAIAGLSVAQLERECKRIFNLSPRQLILAARIDLTANLLRSNAPISDIASNVGYSDHSAFSRQFRALTGFSPRQFRQAVRS